VTPYRFGGEVAMPKKTLTEKTLTANRLNAKRSTGPRTERGKNNSKFNAVKAGLFAKQVVIPLCDGEGSEQQFARLLADLNQEFRPEGPLEELYVEKLAKSMWRFRRATCAEKGSVRRGKLPDIYVRLKTKPITDAIGIVQSAQMEIKTTGTLSPAAYAAVLAEIRTIQACGPQSEEGIILAEPKIDDQFLLLLERCRKLLEMALEGAPRRLEEKLEDSRPMYALPSDSVVSDILRYETAAEKEFDWALQKLLESQQRRRKAQAPVSV
jgi:hypothetical protein